ncbi:VOC family protein [Brevibacterium sp.]|uniref:VOC family protein n=1 Tax=Brevibacterium sp. TaxID=1701 RepID=UPI0025C73D37|nr:VOC family protein [Brevibacterium sp.]
MSLSVRYAFLPHTDPEASLAFYRDVLGFTVSNDVGYEDMRWITLDPPSTAEGASVTSLVLEPPACDPTISEEERRTILELIAKGSYASLTLAVDDLDAFFEKVEAAGAEVVQEPIDQEYGVRDCAFRDPAGNLLRVNEAG